MNRHSPTSGGVGLPVLTLQLKRFRPRHWWTAAVLCEAVIVFSVLFVDSFRFVDRVVSPTLEKLEAAGPP